MLISSIVFLVVVSYYFYINYYRNKVAKNLEELLQTEAVILDVRTKVEYEISHIENAINIPLGSLNSNEIALRKLNKQETIITCCSHGIRSLKAVELLRNNDFTNAYNGGSWKHLKKLIK